jgi:oligopeptide/dipeptide ABC transporter ATP-binding protein
MNEVSENHISACHFSDKLPVTDAPLTQPAIDEEKTYVNDYNASDDCLTVKDLKMHFPVYGGIFRRKKGKVYAVDGVSFSIKPGETVGLVGESGCGKTTAGRTILRLYKPTAGDVMFKGNNISHLPKKEMRDLRRDMQMIFQDPFESLNSRHTIGEILEEPFIIHNVGGPEERKKEVYRLLERVGLPKGSTVRFPHEFSGGQRQRIGIARAIALKPKLIICDEPVSALDVSIQSQILNLLLELQQEMKLSCLFIAHDLAVVKHISDRIAVMYLGKIVEFTDADTIYKDPKHPYTQALISAIPIPDPEAKREKQVLVGDVPSPINPPQGCLFHTRCPKAIEICTITRPNLLPLLNSDSDKHLVACHLAG